MDHVTGHQDQHSTRAGIRVRAATLADRDRWLGFLEGRGMRYAARLGELHDPFGDDALLAEDDGGALVGVLTYQVDGMSCEITTLYTAASGRGIGSALMESAVTTARVAGCARIWLVTTNDNVDALRFYQRRGFRLAELHPGAVDHSRATLKPSIPEVGDHGIPLHDELVLERRLRAGGANVGVPAFPRHMTWAGPTDHRGTRPRTRANLDHDTQPSS